MKLGFTGTQRGLSGAQRTQLRELISKGLDEAHHGDCVGADREFHDIVRVVAPYARIIGHPPDEDYKRAWCIFDESRPTAPYLVRNQQIVNESTEGLIVCPYQMEEIIRSGTWATYRYARKIGRKTIIIYPNGITEVLGA